MKLQNFTRMSAGFTGGLRPDGREVLVVVVKGTFDIPMAGQAAVLSELQAPLIDADVYTGDPGTSSTLYESDYAPVKPRCDVLLIGSAYAPAGKPVQKIAVAISVGTMAKTFYVVGNRVWTRGVASIAPSEPEYFTKMPFSYDTAFGGVDASDPEKPRYYPANHCGCGFHHHMDLDKVIGQPLPNTEEIDNPITNPRGSYRPMALGPIGRAWQPRSGLAGTYDQNWIDNVCPFLPEDFRDEYYQAAPVDQQIRHLAGGEEVSLHNLTPAGRTEFRLPVVDIPVIVRSADPGTKPVSLRPVIDTLIIEPDFDRFCLVWRAHLPLRRNIHEIRSIQVGEMPAAQRRAEQSAKRYFPSLGELTAAKSAGGVGP